MFFAAKEAVEKKAMEKGRLAERKRIGEELEKYGLSSEEISRILSGAPPLPSASRPYRRRYRRSSNGR